MRALRTSLFVALTIVALTAGCRRGGEPTAEPVAVGTAAGQGPGGRELLAPEPTPGVRFRLSNAEPAGPAAAATVPAAAATPLADDAVNALLARLPALPEAAAEQVAFAFKPGPKPPVVTGEAIGQPFPPATSAGAPPDVAVEPLTVLRYQPEGDIDLASHLAVTFSQPMVPLTAHAALAAADVPVRLAPKPAGQWRWVGTQTLLFEPNGRFPMATTYQVEVPAGTRSATGGSLAAATSWSFRTPPPTVVSFHPQDDPTDRQPLVLMTFDQRVEAGAVLAHTAVEADGKPVEVQPVGLAEIQAATSEADRTVQQLVRDAEDGRWVVFRPTAPLPIGAQVAVTVGPELPSAEGPETTTEAQAFSFQVYAPLQVVRLHCGAQESVDVAPRKQRITDCDPTEPFGLELNNPLDPAAFDPAAITVDPPIPGLRSQSYGQAIMLTGLATGRTDYRVHLPANLGDVFGQTLGQTVEVTFATGDARPALFAADEQMIVLDPAGEPALQVFSINNDELKVRLYRVEPRQWPAFLEYQGAYFGKAKRRQAPPGEEVWSGNVKPQGERDALTAVAVDLTPALGNGVGQVVVVAEPGKWSQDDDNWQNRPIVHWVQVTRLGLDVFSDGVMMQAWLTSLSDGRPVVGAEVTLEPEGLGLATNEDGLAVLGGLSAPVDPRQFQERMIVARQGGDVAMLPAALGGGLYSYTPREGLSWYVFDDRGLYKPGEEVHVKGWLRRYDPGKNGDVTALTAGATSIHYSLVAPNGETVSSGELAVTDSGSFDGTFDLPADIELGSARLDLQAEGDDLPPDEGSHSYVQEVSIAEFRRPEFEVRATAEEPYYFLGGRGVVAADAAYFAGGGLPDAEVSWYVSANPTNFTPPGRDDFQFGTWQPWWSSASGPYDQASTGDSYTGRTDATGRHRLAIDFEGVQPLSPVSFRTEATVMDVNRQAWTGSTAILVHPASHYVGLRADRWFADPGQSFEIQTIVADLDGALVSGSPVAMTAERLDWVYRNGDYVEDAVPAGECAATSATAPVSCRFSFDAGGTYRLTSRITDPAGRANQSQLTLWVSGGQASPRRGVEQEQVTLVPDSDEYQPGDTAAILVQAPFAPAEGLLTIRRSGIVATERISLDGPSTTLQVPIEEGYIPNVYVQMDLVGAAPRLGEDGTADPSLPSRPAFASGSINLPVPPRLRTLAVEAAAREPAVEPGDTTTTIDLTVRDADGAPLADAEVALVVADEAVLALTAYEIPDPVAIFYPPRGPDVGEGHLRSLVQLADLSTLLSAAAAGEPVARGAMLPGAGMLGLDAASGAPMAPAMAEMAQAAPMDMAGAAIPTATAAQTALPPGTTAVTERSDLNPLAAFEPALRTDAEGRASVEVTLPDNVSRYRITAVATDGGQRFGTGESTLTARLPLVVRPSAPRFLNFGDAFELPIVVQNQTAEDLEVDVVVRTANLALTAGAGRHLTVPAEDRVEIRFPAAAALPGTAVIQAGAFSSAGADAQRVMLPVWTPATTEAFATYGELDAGPVAQPVVRPPDVVAGFGGLEITTSATALSALTDAFIYLQDYPYDGTEQIASRLVATVALRDFLAAFGAAGLPSAAEIDAAVRRDLTRLIALQNSDGGFGWWRRDEDSNPFVTIHVAHALARAAEAGADVDVAMLDLVRGYLEKIDNLLSRRQITGRTRLALKAYALYVRDLMGFPEPAAARELFAESDEQPVEALGWLLYVLSGDPDSTTQIEAIRRQLANRVSEEAGTAQFTTDYDEEGANVILASDRRADAVVLEALINDQPASDLIPKLVRGLLGHRVRGRWTSTQENAFVLVALARYFRAYEAEAPDFVARAWLGDGFLGEGPFRGRTPDRQIIDVPLSALPDGEAADLVLAKDGPGRLYYRLGLRYAPADLALEATEHGFSIERVYEAIDDSDDVALTADGSWRVRAGARLRVRLTMVTPARRYHVALVDGLPAGLEALNPDLAVSGSPPPESELGVSDGLARGDELGLLAVRGPAGISGGFELRCCWWGWRWWDHDAFRDERVEVFADQVPGGIYRYSYLARATTPGEFVVPPAKAEELYQPETFGRSASDRLIVR